MDNAIEIVLADYDARAAAEHKLMQELPPKELARRIDEFLISVGPNTGRLMNLLIKEAKARTILELGTSYGYSAIWLAEAARATGGKLISSDVHPGKQDHARAQLAKAGLLDYVEFRLGDARKTIAALETPLDFVLIDLWKELYIPCFGSALSRDAAETTG
ncbi:MAG: class I SAM-dependent methyltransferase [Proteobacteria bacterium]|nr:class I SAM-dependent methyltransferase [Pseudomonadota bacterium]